MVLNAVQVSCGAVCAGITSSTVYGPSLGPGTACDAVRARQVGGAQVKVNRNVSCLVTEPKATLRRCRTCGSRERRVSLLAGAWHGEESRAFTTGVVQAAESHKSELPGAILCL